MYYVVVRRCCETSRLDPSSPPRFDSPSSKSPWMKTGGSPSLGSRLLKCTVVYDGLGLGWDGMGWVRWGGRGRVGSAAFGRAIYYGRRGVSSTPMQTGWHRRWIVTPWQVDHIKYQLIDQSCLSASKVHNCDLGAFFFSRISRSESDNLITPSGSPSHQDITVMLEKCKFSLVRTITTMLLVVMAPDCLIGILNTLLIP